MFLRILTVAVLLIVVGYGIHEAIPLFLGPRIYLSSPENGENLYNSFITISGQAIHTESVQLDGNPLVTDENGNFQTTLTLPPGGAILSITATDRFGRVVNERRTVFVR